MTSGLTSEAMHTDLIILDVFLQEALAVRQVVNGFKLDKSHTFAVNLFDEIDKYMRIPDVYESPEDKKFEPTVSPASHPSRL